jgi:hypothetical protein
MVIVDAIVYVRRRTLVVRWIGFEIDGGVFSAGEKKDLIARWSGDGFSAPVRILEGRMKCGLCATAC